MLIETLTTDEFLDLTKADHEAAIELYEREALRLSAEAQRIATLYEQRGQYLDTICSYLTIRKVHRGRLEEIQEDEAAAQNGSSLPSAA